MKQAFLTAVCTLLLLSVALGGVGYTDTVNFLENTVGNITETVDRARDILFDVKVVPETDLLNTKGFNPFNEDITLKEFLMHTAKYDGGCYIPDIDAIYPYTYTAIIGGSDVEGIRFTYLGNDFILWCHRNTHWGGYITYEGAIPRNVKTYVVKVGIGAFHYSSEYDLSDLRLNPLNWRFNTTVKESSNGVLDFVRADYFD